MKDNIKHQRQLAATIAAAAELNARQPAPAGSAPEPPRPGDVFLSRRAADFPVEWLIIEAGDDGVARVVPIDEHPYAGSRDLELAPEALGGAGVVRCDLDARLDVSAFEPELRTAVLTELDLARVRRKRRAIADETLEPSLLEEVVDGDPEYERWRDGTLRPALDALTGQPAERPGETVPVEPVPSEPVPGEPVPSEPVPVEPVPVEPRRRWPRWAAAAAAAAAVLALALPLGWQAFQLSRQLDQEQGRVTRLEQERQALEARLADAEAKRQTSTGETGRLEAALADAIDAVKAGERALAEQRQRFDHRLRSVLDHGVVVNVPSFELTILRTRSLSGEPVAIDPGDAARLTLSLEVPDPGPYPRYRLRIVEVPAGREVWSTDDLVKIDGKWLRLDIPTEFFGAAAGSGQYQLLIYGLGPHDPRQLSELYTVKIE